MRLFIRLLLVLGLGAGFFLPEPPVFAAYPEDPARMSAVDLQEWVNEHFQQGKVFYDKGDYESAFREWDTIAAYVEPGSAVGRVINFLKRRVKLSPAPVPASAPVPPALPPAPVQNQPIQAPQTVSSQSQELAARIQKGKLLYAQGRYEEAVAEWEAVRPSLDPGSAETKMLDELRGTYLEYQRTQRAGTVSSASRASAFAVPEGFFGFLSGANQQLKDKTRQYQSKLDEAQRSASEVQAEMNTVVERGKDYYENGQYAEAIREWKALEPYFEAHPELGTAFRTLETNYEELKKSADAENKWRGQLKDVQVPYPNDFTVYLNEANKKLKGEIQEIDLSRSSVQRDLAERKLEIERKFAQGRDLFNAGRVSEALDLWNSLLPYLENGGEIKTLIDEVAATQRGYAAAQAEADRAAALNAERVSVPSDFSDVLASANENLHAKLAEARRQKSLADQSLGERQAQIDAIFEEGRSLYSSGQASEAMAVWEKLVPYFDSQSGEKQLLDTVRQTEEELLQAKKAAVEAIGNEYKGLKVPRELGRYFTEANLKFKTEIEKARSQRSDADQALATRQDWFDATFQKAQAFYQSGRYEEAIVGWESLASNLDEGSGERAQIEVLKQSHAEYLNALRARDEALSRKDTLFPAPEALTEILRDAKQSFQTRADAAREEERLAEATLTQRQEKVDQIFENGRRLYNEGNLKAALDAWHTLLPFLEGRDPVQALVDQVSQIYLASQDAEKQKEEAQAKQTQKLQSPQELRLLLDSAAKSLAVKTESALGEKAGAQEVLAGRQRFVDSNFEKGKTFFEQGQYAEAVSVWSVLGPYLENEAEISELVQRFSASHAALEDAARQRDEAVARQALRFPAPAELSALLLAVRQKYQTETDQALSETKNAEKSFKDREVSVAQDLQKARALYEGGKVDEALSHWQKLAHNFENGAEIQSFAASISENYKRSLEAGRRREEAAAKLDAKLAAPGDLSAMLLKAQNDLKAQTQRAAAEEEKLQKTYVERQGLFNASFEKGRLLYEKGQYGEAIGEWEKMLPYLDEKSDLGLLMQNARQNYKQAESAKRSAVEFAANELKRPKVPAELAVFLGALSDKMNRDTEKARREETTAKAALSEKETLIGQLFSKGQSAYAAGHFEEAVKLWSQILPNLEESSEAHAQIRALEKNAAALELARKAAADAQARQDQKLKAAPDLLKALDQANQNLVNQKAESDLQTSRLGQMLAERQAWLRNTFQKAKALFDQGKVIEAVEIWNVMASYTEDEAPIRQALKNISGSHAQAQKASAEAAEALAKKDKKVTLPEDFKKALVEADQQLKEATGRSEALRAAAQKERALRQARIQETFLGAQNLYAAGESAKAFELWDSIAPELENGGAFKSQVDELRRQHQELLESVRLKDEATAKQAARFEAPAEWTKELAQIDGELKAQTSEARARLQKASVAIEQRKAALSDAFAKGKSLYAGGRLKDALDSWETLKPHLDEKSGVLPLLDKARQSHGELELAQKAVTDFAANEFDALKVPYAEEMKTMLQEARARAVTQTKEAQAQKAQMEKDLADRKAWIQSNFDKGKKLLSENREREAMEVWSALTPYLEEETKIKNWIDAVQQDAEKASQAKLEAEEAIQKKDMRFKAPDELANLLSRVDQEMKKAIADASAQKQTADQAYDQRQLWVNYTFKDGQNLYDAGKASEALKEWQKMIPFLEEGPALEGLIQKNELLVQDAGRARRAAEEARSRQDSKFKTPGDLLPLLESSTGKLKAGALSSQASQQTSEKAIAERQAWIQDTFEKGRSLFEAGQYSQAAKVWETLAPYVEEEEAMKVEFQKIAELDTQALTAKLDAEQAASRQGQKFQTPAGLVRHLQEANQKMRQTVFDYGNQKVVAEQNFAERQAAVNALFQKGKAYFDTGQVMAAVQEWESLLPYLEEEKQIQEAMQQVSEMQKEALEARRNFEETLTKQNAKLKTPVLLPQFLEDAASRLKTEAFEAQAQKTKAEESLTQKQEWINDRFQKGKAFYDQGQYAEAVDEWQKLVPYMEDRAGMDALIQSVKQSSKEALEAKKAAVEAVADEYKGMKISYSDQMLNLLGQADQALKVEVAENTKKHDQIASTLAERKEWANTTFNKGKIFYDQRRYGDALEQWERLLPYLENQPDLRDLILSFKHSHDEYLNASQRIEEAAANSQAVLDEASIGDMQQFFETTNEKFKKDTVEARAHADEIQKSLQQRKQWVEATFRRAKSFYENGQLEQAAAEWEKLEPYLADQPRMKAFVEEARKNYVEWLRQKKAKEEIEVKAAAEPEVPEQELKKISEAETDRVGAIHESPLQEEPASNQQFISGEITAVNPEKNEITVKLYSVSQQKSLSVVFDQRTEITGGDEKNPQTSLKPGTSVDLRYDPQSKKAGYIYIY